MSSLLQAIDRHECRSTHQKLVLDALRLWSGSLADRWRPIFLRYFEDLLEGAVAPDTHFRDFANHVVLAGDEFSSGAPLAARRWYGRTVQALREKDWASAAYAFGVCSHYVTDPLQPLHTAHTEASQAIHCAVERSVFYSYDTLRRTLLNELGGFPAPHSDESEDWLASMILEGAAEARQHFQVLVDQFDLQGSLGHAPAGLSEDLRRRFAQLVGRAVSNLTEVLQRACAAAQVDPPRVSLGWMAVLLRVTSPFASWDAWLHGRRQRNTVQLIHREFQRTGTVTQHLPAEPRALQLRLQPECASVEAAAAAQAQLAR